MYHQSVRTQLPDHEENLQVRSGHNGDERTRESSVPALCTSPWLWEAGQSSD